MLKLLHITAHLGGGVGKVLAQVVAESRQREPEVQHTIVCLDALEKSQFADRVTSSGGTLLLCPTKLELDAHIRSADIVQLEWWHHPVVAGWMCSGELPPMRLLIWSHVSGLHSPEIPTAFVAAPHRFLFTSPCSLEHRAMAAVKTTVGERAGVVFSSGGFDEFPPAPARIHKGPLRVGYVGTLNFAKLHPRILDFVAAVRQPDFRLAFIGDPTTGKDLLENAALRELGGQLELRGYHTDLAKQLERLDVLAYLLNPLHYGTTENALLEAMAMGVVPIVLNNPAERYLVKHMESGLVVDNPETFADALDWLTNHPDECARLSRNAARTARASFSIGGTVDNLRTHYKAILSDQKRCFDFRPIFGPEPADWFRSCQGGEVWRFSNEEAPRNLSGRGPSFLYERTKSSVFHYRAVYPADARLARWAQQLDAGPCMPTLPNEDASHAAIGMGTSQ
ncbi:MAG TPA: glycosyltransferase family 4 protein [Nitrospiraceae bacterium]|nr:glycosyltransferase family 4 protein [Nitrospiraceae bacterium]